MPFRTLHSFTVTLDKEVTETTVREENGQKITVESKVVKPVDYTILLKEPSRRERNELALFKDVTYGDAISKGLVPKLKMQQLLGKNDPSNPLSEDEDKNVAELNKRITELGNDYMRLNTGGVPETDEIKERKERVLQEWMLLTKKAIDINTAYQSVYAHTAENYTQTKMLTWLSLHLTYVRDPGVVVDAEPRAMFPGADYVAKDNTLADMEDAQDPLLFKAVEKLPTYWMLYLFNRATKPEDFKAVEEEWAKEVRMREEAEAKAKVEEEEVKRLAKAAEDTAKAAEEFSRQGLTMAETATRTQEAMALAKATESTLPPNPEIPQP